MKTKTTTIGGGAEYARVPERIKMFREACPNGSIETKPTILEDGSYMFSCTVVKDLKDEFSPRATGNALGNKKGIKDFEKLETVAVGRALAFLGYLASGDIASSEEMEEFQEFQEEQKEKIVILLQETSDLAELQKVWNGLTGAQKADDKILAAKDELKKKYSK